MRLRILSLLMILTGTIVLAQTGPMDEVMQIDDTGMQAVELYVTNITVPIEQPYLAGTKQSEMLEIYNPGTYDVNDIGINIFIGTDLNANGFPQHKISVMQKNDIALKAGEKIPLPFTFTVPDLKISGGVFYVELYSSSGALVGFYLGNKSLDINGSSTPIQIEKAYLYSPATQKKYDLEQGPGIGENMPNTELELVLMTTEKMRGVFEYSIDVFADSLQGEKVQTISDTITLQGNEIRIAVPALKAGVYVGSFSAKQGEYTIFPVTFRWIMSGERAKIQTIEVTPSDTIVMDIIGTPTAATAGDFSFEKPVSPIPAKIIATWGTEEIYSQDINLVNYSELLSFALTSVKERNKGGEVTISIISSSSGTVLAQETVVVPPIPFFTPILWMIIGGGILLCVLIIRYFYRRSHSSTAIALLVFCSAVVFVAQPGESYALEGPYGTQYLGDGGCVGQGYTIPTLTLSSPASSEQATCNGALQVTGIATHSACENSSGPFTVQYRFINASNGNATGWQEIGKSYVSGVAGSGHSWSGLNYQINQTVAIPANVTDYTHIEFYLSHQVQEGWQCGGTAMYRQPIAPGCGVPGVCGWANGQTFGEWDSSGACGSGNAAGWGWDANRNGWYWYCAGTEGQASSGWCSANQVLHGACGSIHGTDQQWPSSGSWCAAGTHSGWIDGIWNQKGDRKSGNIWTWNCTGKNGGGTASCQFVHRCPTGQILDNGTCRMPMCLANAAIGVSANDNPPVNATALTVDELPIGLKLIDDYVTTLIADPSKRTELNTANGCQYGCNEGYKMGIITATATSDTTGRWASVTNGGSGYTSVPAVTVTGGTCLTLPTATATLHDTAVSGVTLTGAINCSVAPTLTIAAPTGTVNRCVAAQCLGYPRAIDSTYCPGDTTLPGYQDIPHIRRTNSTLCTDATKCEWFCPAEKPYLCGDTNTCVINEDSCSACATSAPSELKAGTDFPFIQCDAIDEISTHFRYKIEKMSGVAADTYISSLFTIGTSVKHPSTFTLGTYKVTCLYGTSASTDVSVANYGMTAGTCTKFISVKDTDVQGCGDIYSYKGDTLIDQMVSASSFDGRFRCGSRLTMPETTLKPFALRVGSRGPDFLDVDTIMSGFFIGLGMAGSVSDQSEEYNITRAQEISCAVKVGGGYSTNNSCTINACVGASCNIPTTFIVIPSKNLYCTTNDITEYSIGCNPDSRDYQVCINKFTDRFVGNQTSVTIDMQFKIGNNPAKNQSVTCTKSRPTGALNDVVNCLTDLPTGEKVSIFTGDYSKSTPSSYQSVAYIATRDRTNPTSTLAYYTDFNKTSSQASVTPSASKWFNKPVTAKIICNNVAGSGDSEAIDDACQCANQIRNSTDFDTTWTTQYPIGDVATYYKTYNTTTNASRWRVADTAGNRSGEVTVEQINIDTELPVLTNVPSGTGTVVFKFQDTLSGIATIKYIKGTSAPVSAFDANCDATGATAGTISGSNTSEQTLSVSGFAAPQKIAYCVRDNAGNVMKGIYPESLVGCFSASNLSPVPRTDNYITTLLARIAPTSGTAQYGYGMSETTANASCFRSIITANVATYVTNQYTPISVAGSGVTVDWQEPAYVKNNTTVRNSNGYYYYASSSSSAPLVTIASAPASSTPLIKTVVAEGANIQINKNIYYGGANTVLVIIAKKNANNVGGNIYIAPGVTHIDAILIADGSLMNATNGVIKNWIDHRTEFANRLTINGRIYALNTRGGSLKSGGTSPATVIQAGNTEGKYFNTAGTLASTTTISSGAAQDLERFRYVNDDGSTQCTLHVAYLSLATNELPQILTRPSGFAGACGF